MKMNLKSNKGYLGVDISIAVIILLILVPTIMGIVFNINRTQNEEDIKAGALNLAVNTMEISKGIDMTELTPNKIIENLSQDLYSGQIENSAVNPIVVTTSKAVYKVGISVTDYKDENPEATENIVKTVKATVTYKIRGEEKTIELSTVVR